MANVRQLRYYSLQDEFDFGRLKGLLVSDVFDENKSYIYWCLREIYWFLIADDVIAKIYTGEADSIFKRDAEYIENNIRDGIPMPYFNDPELAVKKRTEEKIATHRKMVEAQYIKELEREQMELQREVDRERDRELKESTRDAFSDGDGTELWQFYED